VRRFSALVQTDNRASLGLLTAFGNTRQVSDGAQSKLLIALPPKRGIGVRLAGALRAAAAGAFGSGADKGASGHGNCRGAISNI
jgi:hypothetical protein